MARRHARRLNIVVDSKLAGWFDENVPLWVVVSKIGTSGTIGPSIASHGRMLVVSMCDRKIMRREVDGSLVEHADLSGLAL
jgi:hypothetical protein